MTTRQLKAKYGEPNETGKGYLVRIDLPYPMKLSWDEDVKVTRMSCHKLVADRYKKAFQEILDFYGPVKIQVLGIDIFGGCFNYRKMRNGNSWSTHSWGIAIDLDPINNRLKWGADKASFAKSEYDMLHEILLNNGFENLGVKKGYDYMHWQPKDDFVGGPIPKTIVGPLNNS
jgi:hypothetical protein